MLKEREREGGPPRSIKGPPQREAGGDALNSEHLPKRGTGNAPLRRGERDHDRPPVLEGRDELQACFTGSLREIERELRWMQMEQRKGGRADASETDLRGDKTFNWQYVLVMKNGVPDESAVPSKGQRQKWIQEKDARRIFHECFRGEEVFVSGRPEQETRFAVEQDAFIAAFRDLPTALRPGETTADAQVLRSKHRKRERRRQVALEALRLQYYTGGLKKRERERDERKHEERGERNKEDLEKGTEGGTDTETDTHTHAMEEDLEEEESLLSLLFPRHSDASNQRKLFEGLPLDFQVLREEDQPCSSSSHADHSSASLLDQREAEGGAGGKLKEKENKHIPQKGVSSFSAVSFSSAASINGFGGHPWASSSFSLSQAGGGKTRGRGGRTNTLNRNFLELILRTVLTKLILHCQLDVRVVPSADNEKTFVLIRADEEAVLREAERTRIPARVQAESADPSALEPSNEDFMSLLEALPDLYLRKPEHFDPEVVVRMIQLYKRCVEKEASAHCERRPVAASVSSYLDWFRRDGRDILQELAEEQRVALNLEDPEIIDPQAAGGREEDLPGENGSRVAPSPSLGPPLVSHKEFVDTLDSLVEETRADRKSEDAGMPTAAVNESKAIVVVRQLRALLDRLPSRQQKRKWIERYLHQRGKEEVKDDWDILQERIDWQTIRWTDAFKRYLSVRIHLPELPVTEAIMIANDSPWPCLPEPVSSLWNLLGFRQPPSQFVPFHRTNGLMSHWQRDVVIRDHQLTPPPAVSTNDSAVGKKGAEGGLPSSSSPSGVQLTSSRGDFGRPSPQSPSSPPSSSSLSSAFETIGSEAWRLKLVASIVSRQVDCQQLIKRGAALCFFPLETHRKFASPDLLYACSTDRRLRPMTEERQHARRSVAIDVFLSELAVSEGIGEWAVTITKEERERERELKNQKRERRRALKTNPKSKMGGMERAKRGGNEKDVSAGKKEEEREEEDNVQNERDQNLPVSSPLSDPPLHVSSLGHPSSSAFIPSTFSDSRNHSSSSASSSSSSAQDRERQTSRQRLGEAPQGFVEDSESDSDTLPIEIPLARPQSHASFSRCCFPTDHAVGRGREKDQREMEEKELRPSPSPSEYSSMRGGKNEEEEQRKNWEGDLEEETIGVRGKVHERLSADERGRRRRRGRERKEVSSSSSSSSERSTRRKPSSSLPVEPPHRVSVEPLSFHDGVREVSEVGEEMANFDGGEGCGAVEEKSKGFCVEEALDIERGAGVRDNERKQGRRKKSVRFNEGSVVLAEGVEKEERTEGTLHSAKENGTRLGGVRKRKGDRMTTDAEKENAEERRMGERKKMQLEVLDTSQVQESVSSFRYMHLLDSLSRDLPKRSFGSRVSGFFSTLRLQMPVMAFADYFGETVAIYFAFISHVTVALIPAAVLGLVPFFVQQVHASAHKNPVRISMDMFFSLTMLVWAVSTVIAWERKEKVLMLEMGMDSESIRRVRQVRSGFYGDTKRSPTNGRETTVDFPASIRNARMVVSAVAVSLFLVASMWASLYIATLRSEWSEQGQREEQSGQRKEGTRFWQRNAVLVATFINYMVNSGLSKIVRTFATVQLADWCNIKYQDSYECLVYLCTFAIDFMVVFFPFVYTAFFKPYFEGCITRAPGALLFGETKFVRPDATPPPDCSDELQKQLLSTYFVQLSLNVVELAWPSGVALVSRILNLRRLEQRWRQLRARMTELGPEGGGEMSPSWGEKREEGGNGFVQQAACQMDINGETENGFRKGRKEAVGMGGDGGRARECSQKFELGELCVDTSGASSAALYRRHHQQVGGAQRGEERGRECQGGEEKDEKKRQRIRTDSNQKPKSLQGLHGFGGMSHETPPPSSDSSAFSMEVLVELQLQKAEYTSPNGGLDGIFEDFAEVMLHFAYVCLFVVAFPIAPLLTFFFFVLEAKVDAFKVFHLHRRPVPESCQGIGPWSLVLPVLLVFASIVNAALMSYVFQSFDFLLELAFPVIVQGTDGEGEGNQGKKRGLPPGVGIFKQPPERHLAFAVCLLFFLFIISLLYTLIGKNPPRCQLLTERTRVRAETLETETETETGTEKQNQGEGLASRGQKRERKGGRVRVREDTVTVLLETGAKDGEMRAQQ